MRVSIITVCFNSATTIEKTLQSVLSQKYKDIEYIVIDGKSTDGTLNIIDRYKEKIDRIISEPDKGIYDAMNKGLALASGDIIGFLNSDDHFVDDRVVGRVVREFKRRRVQCVYADVYYIDKKGKVVRHYRSPADPIRGFKRYGFSPAHPTFYVKRDVYERYGGFDLEYETANDYDLMLRFLYKHHITYSYIPLVLVKMQEGGSATRNLRSIIKGNIEVYRSSRSNGLNLSIVRIILKLVRKRISMFFL